LKNKDDKRTAWGGWCPAPALCDEESCRDGDICRHLDRRGGEFPCPRTAGAAAVPTHDHPSHRRTSRAWIMCGEKICFRGSTMTDHSVYSVYLVSYSASHFEGSAISRGHLTASMRNAHTPSMSKGRKHLRLAASRLVAGSMAPRWRGCGRKVLMVMTCLAHVSRVGLLKSDYPSSYCSSRTSSPIANARPWAVSTTPTIVWPACRASRPAVSTRAAGCCPAMPCQNITMVTTYNVSKYPINRTLGCIDVGAPAAGPPWWPSAVGSPARARHGGQQTTTCCARQDGWRYRVGCSTVRGHTVPGAAVGYRR